MGAWASPCSAAGMQYRSQITALLALAALAGCDLEPVEETQADPVKLVSYGDGERMLVPFPAGLGRVACITACSAIGALGCATIQTGCAVGSTITVGGVAVPCLWAIWAGCGAVGGATAGCIESCPE